MSFITVLVVEDNETLRPFLQKIIERPQRRVLMAMDGLAALMLFEQYKERIDLVLADVNLPVLGGVALAEELRRRNPNVTILLMSGAFDDRASGFPQLEKPFSAADLEARIQELLNESSLAPGDV